MLVRLPCVDSPGGRRQQGMAWSYLGEGGNKPGVPSMLMEAPEACRGRAPAPHHHLPASRCCAHPHPPSLWDDTSHSAQSHQESDPQERLAPSMEVARGICWALERFLPHHHGSQMGEEGLRRRPRPCQPPRGHNCRDTGVQVSSVQGAKQRGCVLLSQSLCPCRSGTLRPGVGASHGLGQQAPWVLQVPQHCGSE